MNAKEFIEKVIDDEYKLDFSARDMRKTPFVEYERNRLTFMTSFSFPTVTHSKRTEDTSSRDPEMIERIIQSAEQSQKRLLFKLEKYSNKKWGEIYAAFTSINAKTDLKNYYQIWYIKQDESHWKVFSVYTRDHIDGGWEYANGEKLNNPGKLLETQKFVAPDDPADLEDWNNS
jgi:hypothetical protein